MNHMIHPLRRIMRLTALKAYILYTFLAVLAAYIIYRGVHNTTPTEIPLFSYSNIKTLFHSIEIQKGSLPSDQLKKNIFFLKTHKTGSTTVQNVLMRFGLRHSLDFMLPRDLNTYLGYESPITLNDVDSNSIPPEKKFNIFVHHTRYRREVNQFFYSDTIRVTILRNPAEHFESLFSYYGLGKALNVSFHQFLESRSRSDADTAKLLRGNQAIQGQNQMSRDLGLEPSQYENDAEILKFIQLIDEDFHLVMIQAHMEVSLVLLAHLMGWPLHYVSFIPMNVRETSLKKSMNESHRQRIFQFNKADHLLYKYFFEKFQKRVLEYGFEKLVKDVHVLFSINVELRRRCISAQNYNGSEHTVNYVLKDYSDWECVHSSKEEQAFITEVREEQTARLKLIRSLENLIKVGSVQRG